MQQARALAETGGAGELAGDRDAGRGRGRHPIDARREEGAAPRHQAAPLADGQSTPEAVHEVQVEGRGCHRRPGTLGRTRAPNQTRRLSASWNKSGGMLLESTRARQIGSGAALSRSIEKRLVTFRNGTAAIRRR